MNLHLIQGHFSKTDTKELLSQLVQVKIKFHESKIKTSQSEEDIKMREARIRDLQNQLQQALESLGDQAFCDLVSEIKINES